MVDLDIKVDTSEFSKSLTNANEALKNLAYQRLIAVGSLIKAEAVKEAPSDTGHLRSRMFKRTERNAKEIVSTIGNSAEYALYVHQGTGKYAKNGNGRQKPWKVKTIYKNKKVEFWTAGQKPNPFLERAIQKNMGSIKKLLGVKDA